jgi:hypothetical protein
MGMNFPNTPTVGQQWPSPPVPGQPVYRWDGTVWGSLGAQPGKMPIYSDGSVAMAAQLTLVNTSPVASTDAAAKGYVDTGLNAKLNVAGNQTTTGGFAITAYNATQAGGFTCNPMFGNYQYVVNNGAMTMTAPTVDCAIDYLITNGASAGGITMTGFTYASGNTGDPYVTTNGYKFIFSIRRINGTATFLIKALQ